MRRPTLVPIVAVDSIPDRDISSLQFGTRHERNFTMGGAGKGDGDEQNAEAVGVHVSGCSKLGSGH